MNFFSRASPLNHKLTTFPLFKWAIIGDFTYYIDFCPWPPLTLTSFDLDLWPMKVKLFLWIDYDPISVLYQIQSDMSTNSREIKYQNIEKSLSLIIEWLVSMATKKIRRFDFHENFLRWFSDQNASAVKKSGRSDQYWGLYIAKWRTDRQTAVTNILCKNLWFCKVIRLNDVGSS